MLGIRVVLGIGLGLHACRTYLQFNGSGGIWRKECMDSAGGWNDQTLVEDMDLSLRAYLVGWH